MRKIKKFIKKGDTILEVTFAIMIFSLIAVLSMQIMDRDIAMIQGALETEMARNEIDAQAEALRYIQNAYLSEREFADKDREFEDLWLELSRAKDDDGKTVSGAGNGLANLPDRISQYPANNCESYYDDGSVSDDPVHNVFEDSAFVINTRKIDPNDVDATIVKSKVGSSKKKDMFVKTDLYPRVLFSKGDGTAKVHDEDILAELFPTAADEADQSAQTKEEIYNKVARAEGIWVISARAADNVGNRVIDGKHIPEFYDFHIRTCWFAPGHERPSTIATTIRLYNPEYIEDQMQRIKKQ